MSEPPAEAQAWNDWREQRLARLTAPDGWLCLIDLVWIDEGVHRVGSAADCAVRLPAGPPYLGMLTVAGKTVRWRAADERERTFATDALGETDVVRCGRYSFIVIEREGKLAVRLRDADAAGRGAFSGIPVFPYNPDWRKPARWIDGTAAFEHEGNEFQLTPQDAGVQILHFVFGDATSGRDTYGGGRFLYADAPCEGRLVLDFNRAFNPPCVFTSYATCPLPPPGNRLSIAIAAGEKLPT